MNRLEFQDAPRLVFWIPKSKRHLLAFFQAFLSDC